MTNMKFIAAALFFVAATSPASATLVGDTVEVTFRGNSLGQQIVVVPGVEYQNVLTAGRWDIDIHDSSIDINFNTDSAVVLSDPAPLEIADLNWVNAPTATISDVIFAGSGPNPVLASDITFGANSITVQMDGFWDDFASVSLTIVPSHVDAIPEPNTLTLACLSLLPLGFVGWRRRLR